MGKRKNRGESTGAAFNREVTGPVRVWTSLAWMLSMLAFFSLPALSHAQLDPEPDFATSSLKELSLEELMEIEVTSPGKKLQKLSDVPAAVYVITNDDIRRSGATSIPEALRLAPGVQVARIDANKWAISVRGFDDRYANKLLVLMDGRTVYTPSFSGVFWDIQDTMLEDIERIEVIRGPGAALWGANAVNGVINIITKKAEETQGGLIAAGGGTEERGFGGMRYGLKIGSEAYARGYIKYLNRDGGVNGSGKDTADNWDVLRGGFRLDWQGSQGDSLTFQGDLYDGSYGTTGDVPLLSPPYMQKTDDHGWTFGGNLLSRWEKVLSPTSELALQAYYQRDERGDIEVKKYVEDTIDLDFQHRFHLGESQDIMYGAGYRYIHDRLTDGFLISLSPDHQSRNLFSAFLQDEITLIPDLLRVTLGSKFEHNDFTGFEVQPDFRFLLTPHPRHTIWGSISRAVRTPSRAESDVRANYRAVPPGVPGNPGPLPVLISSFGDRDLDSEVLLAYELGYRAQLSQTFSFDLVGYYHHYDRLIGVIPAAPFPEADPSPPHLVVPGVFANDQKGEVYGVELASDWLLLPWWRMRLSYTYQKMDLRLTGAGAGIEGQTGYIEKQSPDHQISLFSSLDLPGNLTFDTWMRYVDELPSMGVRNYLNLDLRLAWRPLPGLELSLVGQNLIDTSHQEFVSIEGISTRVERGFYGKVVFEF
jgi:iron complex outermembrane receptor protein